MSTLIELLAEPTPAQPVEIVQLYEGLELLRLDQPSRHTLFVLGREEGSNQPDRLLIIDPPADLQSRFRVEGDVAILNSRLDRLPSGAVALPRLGGQPGGVAHIRLGRHFLDIYTQIYYSVIHFPALGIIVAGEFASNVTVPTLAAGDDGTDALETVRLLAALIKGRATKLVIPGVGELGEELVPVMERLAADVAYLNRLQRTAAGMQTTKDEARFEELAATLLPSDRRNPLAQTANHANLHTAIAARTA